MGSQFTNMLTAGLRAYFKKHTPVIRKRGQSNLRGRGVVTELLPIYQGSTDKFKIWSNSTFENYNPAVNAQGDDFGVELWIGYWLYEKFRASGHFDKYGVGGTTLGINPLDPLDQCWHPDGYLLYDNGITQFQNVFGYSFPVDKPPVIIGDLWIHGESDANDGSEYYDVYETNERLYISRSRSDTKSYLQAQGFWDVQQKFLETYDLEEIPFIDIQLSNNTIYPTAGVTAIRTAKTNIANDADVKNTYLVQSDDANLPDGQHYDTASLENPIASGIIDVFNTLYLK